MLFIPATKEDAPKRPTSVNVRKTIQKTRRAEKTLESVSINEAKMKQAKNNKANENTSRPGSPSQRTNKQRTPS